MNRKERRNLQRQGVQVPKDPTLNIKLSALGKSIMTPEMRAAMMHEINQQCLEKDDLLALDVDCMVLWTLHRHLGFGVKRLHDFYLAMAAEHRRMRDFYEMDDLYPERLLLFPAINPCQRLPFCLRKLPFRKLALILSLSFLQLTLLHRKICFIALQQGLCLSSLLHCILCCLLSGSVTFLLCLLLRFRFCKHT